MNNKTYQGTPCRKYGHTERYKSNGACVVCISIRTNKWQIENKTKLKANNRKWQIKNRNKFCEYQKEYYYKHPKLYLHYNANRRARLKRQTPPWVDLEKIKEIYLNCPEGYEVDHIHPIDKGGLHIHYNLQYLPMSENRKKSNKLYNEQILHIRY
jgi:hypothetical protein|tara:strand:- start:59 stop:523 length:465 start_codon:yes stop_codon:yes gene_type:complete